jgi:hypothetical protein
LPPKPTLQLPQRPAQPSRREESAADQALHLAPWSNQHNVRSRIAGQILLQQRREAENRQKQQYQQTPADRAAIVQYQEEMRNWRAGQLSMDRNLQMQITRDNNFLNNATRNMTSARRGEVQDMLNRHNNWMRDPQGGQTGIPYEKGNPEFTAHDQRIRQELIKNGMDLGYFNQPMTPPLGGYPNGPPPHAPVPVAPTPGVKPGASQGDRYNQVYKSDPKDIDSPPPGVTLQPGEEWMRGHRKDGTSTGNWQLRKSQPAPATQ